MKKLISKLGVAAMALVIGATAASAAAYPKKKPREQEWSFAGPFGQYDDAQLQRGMKVYVENCSACHGLKRVAFRTLDDLGYSDAQIRTFAATYQIENEDGDLRTATPADYFPESALDNAPDLSLMAKARAPKRGFPTFVFDVFTQYQESGPDYIYSLLTGYSDDVPEDITVPEGTHYNPYFISGTALSMAPPLFEDGIEFDDGTAATVSQQAQDVAAFLMWTAEPKLEERKQLGFRVMIFLLVFAAFLYLSKKQVWSRIPH